MSLSLELQKRVDKACETFVDEIQECLKINSKLHEMDADQRLFALETEILPVIDNIINHDPTEQTPFQFFHK